MCLSLGSLLSCWFMAWTLCLFTAALLREQWEALALRLSQTQQQIRACETALVFSFVEVSRYNVFPLPPSWLNSHFMVSISSIWLFCD